MAGNQKDLADWALEKSEQYLESAKANLSEGRLYVAAEEAFRAIENCLEAMLYQRGIIKIAYPGGQKEFVGRLALQFLVRDNLVNKGIIQHKDYDLYLAYASRLHKAGYTYGRFEKNELVAAMEFAERLYYRARKGV